MSEFILWLFVVGAILNVIRIGMWACKSDKELTPKEKYDAETRQILEDSGGRIHRVMSYEMHEFLKKPGAGEALMEAVFDRKGDSVIEVDGVKYKIHRRQVM